MVPPCLLPIGQSLRTRTSPLPVTGLPDALTDWFSTPVREGDCRYASVPAHTRRRLSGTLRIQHNSVITFSRIIPPPTDFVNKIIYKVEGGGKRCRGGFDSSRTLHVLFQTQSHRKTIRRAADCFSMARVVIIDYSTIGHYSLRFLRRPVKHRNASPVIEVIINPV